VIISKERILDISAEEYDALVALSQPAYEKFSKALRPQGTLVYDSDLVKPSGNAGSGIPSTALAKKHLGKELYANMVIFGHFVNVSGIVDEKSAEEAIAACVPAGTAPNNLKAFGIGFGYARKPVKERV
jgi:2-oxoglutarate ferredoxin oxidoreductase subunit gamma